MRSSWPGSGLQPAHTIRTSSSPKLAANPLLRPTFPTSSTPATLRHEPVRSTRLVALVNTMDPKVVAVAFGMDFEAAMIYLADYIDPTGCPTHETLHAKARGPERYPRLVGPTRSSPPPVWPLA